MNDVNEMIYELKNMIYNNTVNKDTIIEVFEYLQSLQPKVPKFYPTGMMKILIVE